MRPGGRSRGGSVRGSRIRIGFVESHSSKTGSSGAPPCISEFFDHGFDRRSVGYGDGADAGWVGLSAEAAGASVGVARIHATACPRARF